uniref:Kelch-like family member 8 n=1 Tax=Cyprinus carpio TaxID=7962 RepID=A0A8C2D285_CYPCA
QPFYSSLTGVLFCVGGRGGSGDPFRSIECYSISKNSWFFGPEMNSRRRHVGVISVGYVYAVGGNEGVASLSSVERFDPRTDHWEYVAELTTPRGGVGVATVMGRVFAVGGHNGNIYLNTVEAFEPRMNRISLFVCVCTRWEMVGSVSHCRAGAGVAVCSTHISQIRDVGQGSSNVADCM